MKHIGNLEITSKNENDFKDIKEVTGYVRVYGSAKLDVPKLETVGGYVRVDGSAKLDAPKLETVGGYVYVYGSAKLDALTTVGGDVYVSGSAKLDVPKLETVGGYVYVYGSAKLDAPKLETVGGYVRVDGSAKLDAPKLETVGGDVYVDGSAKLDAPKLINKNDPKAAPKCAKKLELSFKKKKLIKVDGILSWLVSKRKIGLIVTMKIKIVGKLDFSFVIKKGKFFSHGKTIKEAKESLKYKLSDRDTSRFKKWKLTEPKKFTDLIVAYRAITGACESGTKLFCESQKLKSKYTVKEVIKLTEGRYGNEQFKKFFEGEK